MENLIMQVLLENAVKFNGTPNQKAVLGKLLGIDPSLKQDVPALQATIAKLTEQIQTWSVEQQQQHLATLGAHYTEQKKEKREGLVPLQGDTSKVIMRFAPSPSGPMHIGHALTGGLTALYCKQYKGTFILRIEDTNSDNIDVQAYDMLPQEAQWLFGKVDEVWIQSDRLSIYYKYLEQLIEQGDAYVDHSTPEEFKMYIQEKKESPCRLLSAQEHMLRWQKMFDTYKEGQAVVRMKTDMTHKNPAMRDFPLARINDSEHPRQKNKYRVWPLMNLAVTVDDIEAGMTHIVRAKDHADNAKRQEYIYKALQKPIPHTSFVGKIQFEDIELSASKTKQLITQGVYSGWDDIRLPTIAALKKRGYQPEAFLGYTHNIGVSLTDKHVSRTDFFKTLDTLNTSCIDAKTPRVFMVRNPVTITVQGAPTRRLELDIHPEHHKGGRFIDTTDSYMVEAQDIDVAQGDMIRLMDNANIVKTATGWKYHSDDYDIFKKEGKAIIHWLPVESCVLSTLRMPDNSTIPIAVEKTIEHLDVNDVIQAQRIGYCCVQKKEVWFGHA
ncbi:MAG: glutamate--tRNA ligase [Candidatus Woesearchaeota archaeon]